jgi:hypothetical protein
MTGGTGDEGRHQEGHPVLSPVVPEWAKFAGSIIATVVLTIGWAESRFVSRIEWASHQAQQSLDMSEIKVQQTNYAAAERGTAAGVNALSVDVAEIKADVGWLRSYLDVTKPLPRRKAP